jgi:hypothetical protein
MKRLSYLLAIGVALTAAPVMAQCSSCAATAPRFQSAGSVMAPMYYHTGQYGGSNWTPAYGNAGNFPSSASCCQPMCQPVCRPVHQPVCHTNVCPPRRQNRCMPMNCCNPVRWGHAGNWHCHPMQTFTSQAHFMGSACCGGMMSVDAMSPSTAAGYGSAQDGLITAPENGNVQPTSPQQTPDGTERRDTPPSPDAPETNAAPGEGET